VRSALLVTVGLVIAGACAASAAGAGRLHVVHAHQGTVRAELSYRLAPGATFWERGRLRIWNRRRLLVDRRTGPGSKFQGRPIAVRQLDGTGLPEVLLVEFTGGNGCCWTTWIYTGARRIKAPWLYVPPNQIRDGDGDGRPEFHGTEPRWYTWASRGEGRYPVKVWTYSGGAVQDVTRSFPAEVQADQAQHYAVYQSAVAAGNPGLVRNALAAYVADGYTLGQGDAAMAVLQAAISAGEVEDIASSTADYVETLRRLLREDGYDTT
jgi:hypothetical protein